MANTHPRCYPPGVDTGVPVAYDRTAANNNSIIVNESTIDWQKESIQAQATSANQNCCNEPPNIKSPLGGDSMLFHGEEVLNNVRENVLFLINQEIEKWEIEMYTLICKLGQLSNDLSALAKNCNYLRGLRNLDNEISTTQVAAATYLNNQNELNISSNVGDGIRCQIFDDSDCSDSATVEAEFRIDRNCSRTCRCAVLLGEV
jgi:hypothetical protein